MLSYYLYRKNTECKNTKLAKTNKGKLLLLSSKNTVSNSKKIEIYQKTRN